MDSPGWNLGLVQSGLLMLVAVELIVLARTRLSRLFGLGVFAQGAALLFVAARAEFPRANLEIPAVGVLAVFGAWSIWMMTGSTPESLDVRTRGTPDGMDEP